MAALAAGGGRGAGPWATAVEHAPHMRFARPTAGRGAQRLQKTPPQVRQWCRRRVSVKAAPHVADMQRVASRSGTHGAGDGRCASYSESKAWPSVCSRSTDAASKRASDSCTTSSCPITLPCTRSSPQVSSAIAADLPPTTNLRAASAVANSMVAVGVSTAPATAALTVRRPSTLRSRRQRRCSAQDSSRSMPPGMAWRASSALSAASAWSIEHFRRAFERRVGDEIDGVQKHGLSKLSHEGSILLSIYCVSI